jgi:Fe-S-cluster-containing hydrogenase component 2
VRDEHGVVTIYEDKCIGCGNCASYCPYGVIFMVEAPEHHSFWEQFNVLNLLGSRRKAAVGGGGHRTLAVKCDLCQNDPKGPACVRSCPTGAAIRVSPAYFTQVEYRGGDGA